MSEAAGPFKNTDRELWREADDEYAPSLHVTERGGIGINVGGRVYVKPLRDWHTLAEQTAALRALVIAAKRLNDRMPTGSISARDIPIIEVLEICKIASGLAAPEAAP